MAFQQYKGCSTWTCFDLLILNLKKMGFFDNHVTWNYLVNKSFKAYNHIPRDLTIFWRIILFMFTIFFNSKGGVGAKGCVCVIFICFLNGLQNSIICN
jgi:hypothetical protein